MAIDLKSFREKYPKYNNWDNERLANAINLKHEKEGISPSEKGWAGIGSDIQESASNFFPAAGEMVSSKGISPSEKGWAGIGSDIQESASNFFPAAGEMVSSIWPGIKNIAKYATSHNPLETLGNIGAGIGEAGAGVLSGPQIAARYIGEKFPSIGEAMGRNAKSTEGNYRNTPTLYESLMNWEKEKGLASRSEEESSVRNLGGLVSGGKVLSALRNPFAGLAAVTSEVTGRGGDPLHAAILGSVGNVIAKAPWKEAVKPANVTNAIKNIPEMAGRTAASVLESGAELASSIPGAGKIISPIVQPTAGALGSYLKHISVSPEELAKRNLFGDIEAGDIPGMEKLNEAAKRLNLTYLTPSELLNSPFEAVKQGDIGRTKKGMKELYKKGEAREASEEAAINKLFDLIHEDNLEPVKKAAYEQTMKNILPDEFIKKQEERPVIKKAMKSVENNTAYKQMLQEEYGVSPDNVAKNSFMYWDMVKRVLGDMEKKLGRKGADTEASIYGNTRRSLVKGMDLIEPQYKVARNIAERKFTREELEAVFDKKDKNFNNFQSYLKSKEKFDRILEKLEAFPKAKQQLQDIKLFSGKMIPNNPTIRAQAALKRTGMSDARNAIEAKKREFDQKYGEAHDVAAVNMMTDPNLLNVIKKHIGYKSPQNIFSK